MYKLKILSGSLAGVEYTLQPGDTVFHLAPHRELVEGVVASTIALADNTYFVPHERKRASFIIRLSEQTGENGGECSIGETDDNGAVTYRELTLNTPVLADGFPIAIRLAHVAWSIEVASWQEESLPDLAETSRPSSLHRRAIVAISLAALLTVALLGWHIWHAYLPESRVLSVEEILADAPHAYEVRYGRDKHVYAFADSADAVVWGERAGRRLRALGDVRFIHRGDEAARLGALLEREHITYAVLRLKDASQPVVVLVGDGLTTKRLTLRVQSLIGGETSYASRIDVESITDAALVVIARDGLRALGISSRLDTRTERTSISNDVFLDDPSLNAMMSFSRSFASQWGSRRVAIKIRLWDDLLKGRSYEYTPNQLLSVGNGSWQFAKSTDG